MSADRVCYYCGYDPRTKGMHAADCPDSPKRLRTADKQVIAELKEAPRMYGGHLESCPAPGAVIWKRDGTWVAPECSCGFREVGEKYIDSED